MHFKHHLKSCPFISVTGIFRGLTPRRKRQSKNSIEQVTTKSGYHSREPERIFVDDRNARANNRGMGVPLHKKLAQQAADKVEQHLDSGDINRAVARELKHLNSKSKTPKDLPEPDEKRLQLVWHLWHLLPKDWSAESRVQLLLTPAAEIPGLRLRLADNHRRVTAKRKLEYHQQSVGKKFWHEFTGQFNVRDAGTFETARWWDWFVGQFQKVFAFTMQKDGKRLYVRLIYVEQQLAFQDFQMHNPGDIATYRTVLELQITHPKFWEISSPALDLIHNARRRWESYETAQHKAAAEFRKFIFPEPILKGSSDQRRARHEQLAWLANPKKQADYLSGKFLELSLYDQERFIKEDLHSNPLLTQPYEDYAINIACGIIAPDVFRKFMAEDFVSLTQREQLHFVRLCHERREENKKNKYILLKTWLLQNVPVLQEFGWRMDAVIAAVAKRFLDYPGMKAEVEAAAFKSALSEWGIVLNLQTGRKRASQMFAASNKQLLTGPPKPLFQSNPHRK